MATTLRDAATYTEFTSVRAAPIRLVPNGAEGKHDSFPFPPALSFVPPFVPQDRQDDKKLPRETPAGVKYRQQARVLLWEGAGSA
ncbi:MAG: hypothetical protein V3S46_03540 [Nitrospinota bacterium]